MHVFSQHRDHRLDVTQDEFLKEYSFYEFRVF